MPSALKNTRGLRRGAAWLAMPAAVAAVGLLAACSSSSSSSSPAAGSPSATTPAGGSSSASSPPATAGGTVTVTVTETEFHIVLSTTSFHPGVYKFVAVDKGHASHNLVITGPGVSQAKTADLISPGESEPVTVTLQKGTYDIYCGVPGHKALGMDVHITVS